MSTHLETRDLTIRFGGHVAVDAVTCAFRPGELTAIVGPNGAGKTTYFNLISGQLRASAGHVLFNGEDLTRLPRLIARAPRIGTRVPADQPFSQSHGRGKYAPCRAGEARRALRDAARLDPIAPILSRVLMKCSPTSHSTARRNVAAAALSHGDQRKLEVGDDDGARA